MRILIYTHAYIHTHIHAPIHIDTHTHTYPHVRVTGRHLLHTHSALVPRAAASGGGEVPRPTVCVCVPRDRESVCRSTDTHLHTHTYTHTYRIPKERHVLEQHELCVASQYVSAVTRDVDDATDAARVLALVCVFVCVCFDAIILGHLTIHTHTHTHLAIDPHHHILIAQLNHRFSVHHNVPRGDWLHVGG
jgi:hypothetical protein